MSGLGWVLSAQVTSVSGLCLTSGLLCGVGTGIVYVGIVRLMLEWFPDRRGLATGGVAAGRGVGAIVTTFPIATMISTSGHRMTLVTFGITLGSVSILMRQLPESDGSVSVRSIMPGVAPGRMLATPVFWPFFIMMTMMSTGGLMVVSQFAPFMHGFGVANVMVFGMAALPFALTLDRITKGLTRPLFGWVSDKIGRENTMSNAFTLEAAGVFLMLNARHNAMLFILMSGVVFFGWGAIFSLFPATLTDTFGVKHAITNYGLLYMAQGIGSGLGGPVAAALHDATKSWVPVFVLIIVMDLLSALPALTALRPMRLRFVIRQASLSDDAPRRTVHPPMPSFRT